MERIICVAGNLPCAHKCSTCKSSTSVTFRLSRFGVVFSCSRIECAQYRIPAVTLAQCVERWAHWTATKPYVLLGSQCCVSSSISGDGLSSVDGGGCVISSMIECIPRLCTASSSSFSKGTSCSTSAIVVPYRHRVRVFVMLKRNEVVITAPDVNVLMECLPDGIRKGLRRMSFSEAGDHDGGALCGPLLLLDPLYNELESIFSFSQSLELTTAGVTTTVPKDWRLDGLPRCIRASLDHEVQNPSVGSPSVHRCLSTPSHSLIHPHLWNTLLRHQRAGVVRALELRGRILFGDDMGVGKTLQAIATMQALHVSPMLIVCPAGLRHLWIDIVETWWPSVALENVHVIYGANDKLPQLDEAGRWAASENAATIVICSYHMLAALHEDMERRRWACVTLDESHMLRPNLEGPIGDAQYTRVACRIGRAATHCLMLSGTPSLTSPFGLYLQADTIWPGVLGATRHDFALDYCQVTMDPFLSIGACDRVEELRELLSERVMIRRTKTEVLHDLPPKRRIVVHLARALKRGSDRHDDEMDDDPVDEEEHNYDDPSLVPSSFPSRYAAAWKLHQRDLFSFISATCKRHFASQEKLVIFAHHVELLHALRDVVRTCIARSTENTSPLSMIFLDGSIPPQSRPQLIDAFQTDPMCLAAVIGVTVAAVGISLSAASTCIFAELPPDVAWLQQAEDRLHRPHQASMVTSMLVVDPASPMDSRLLHAMSNSFVATKDVLDGKSRRCSVAPSCAASGAVEQCTPVEALVHGTTRAEEHLASTTQRTFPAGQGHQQHPSNHAQQDIAALEHPLFQLDIGQCPRANRTWDPCVDILFQRSPFTYRLHIAVSNLDSGDKNDDFDVQPHIVLGSLPFEEARLALAVSTTSVSLSPSQAVLIASLTALFRVWDDMPWLARQRVWSKHQRRAAPSDLKRGWLNVRAMEQFHRTIQQLPLQRQRVDDEVTLTPRKKGIPERYEQKWDDYRQHLHQIGPMSTCTPPPPVPPAQYLPPQYTPFVVWRVEYEDDAPYVDYPGPLMWQPPATTTLIVIVVLPLAAPLPSQPPPPGFVCACLNCRTPLRPTIHACVGQVVLIVVGESDSRMFCSGNCRCAYFFAKSSSAIRRTVQEVDRGQCSGCGVDCDALVRDLAALTSIDEAFRANLYEVGRFLADAPVHAARLLRSPSAGYCWHADHIVAVWQGGGQANMTNLQTLCIPCHLVKSKWEARVRATASLVSGVAAPLKRRGAQGPLGTGAPRRRLAV
ncbi:SNF2 DNA repair protein, putative [Bodo saltans]|uniref:SNF2 DNA repair protein, putative n=1 Tax=Bodo saltans TaxID=75058 RepID=A0A0S4JYG1_BODSA|nr:SNF2 DNA repair protein, putative [Bodo saltans]|eukprot:CUG94192.1 SNF2 DNA repair protein, putative [Bodo saltans]